MLKELKNKLLPINKLKIFQIVLICLFFLFLIFLFIPKNYTKTYTINKVKITESYNKKNKSYYFTFNYNNKTLDMLFESNYHQNRTFIKDLKIIKDNDNFCITPVGDIFSFYPICYDNNNIVSFNMVNNTLKNKLDSKYFPKTKKISTYNDIDIYNTDYSYYIWNYNGFYYLNNTKNTKIKIFDKEQYNINLIGYTKDYLVIPDYDSNYTFNTFYTISLTNGDLKKHKLDRDIYFDSYYPGYIKNKLYIVDNKENTMYEFNASNGDLEKYPSKIYKENKWENMNIKTIISNKEMFTYKTNYHYTLKDHNLYLKYQNISTLVSNNITSIVRFSNADIFYLKDNELYHYNPLTGENLLLSYFEWHFNSNNMIYLQLPN